MYRLLVILYPRAWQQEYGDEYEVLLQDLGLSPAIIINSIKSALLMQVYAHRKLFVTAAGMTQYVLCERFSLQSNLTNNVFWLPGTFNQGIWFVMTIMPVFYICYVWLLPKSTVNKF